MAPKEFQKYREVAQRLYEAMAAFVAESDKHPDGIEHLLTPQQNRELKQIEDQINGLVSRCDPQPPTP